MRILVTCASGFLGSALLARWVRAGHDVMGLLRHTSSVERVAAWADRARLETPRSDGDMRSLIGSFRPDVVAHTACAYGRAGESSLALLDANVRLGVLLLEQVLENRHPCLFLNTGTALSAQVSTYAMAKQHFSEWASRMVDAPGHGFVKLVDVRLEYMFGPGDSESKFPAYVVNHCLRNEPELPLTGCEQRRDFIYIDDVVEAYDHLVAHGAKLSRVERISLGSGQSATLRSFVEMAHRLTHSRTKLLFGALPYRPGEAPEYRADLDRLNQLGWTPRFDVATGLIDWLSHLGDSASDGIGSSRLGPTPPAN